MRQERFSRCHGRRYELVLLVVFFLVCIPGTARSVSKQDILLPYENSLAQCKAALTEVQRQAELHSGERNVRIAFLEERQEDIDKAEERVRQEFEARKASLDRAVLAGWQLINDLGDVVHVPLHGAMTMEELRGKREAQEQDIARQLELLETGEYEVPVAGLGLLTRKELDARIQTARQELESLEQTIEAGAYAIHYPGLGQVDRTRLEAHKALLEERIKSTSEQIAAGEYVVTLPHLGPISKNGLEARITALKEKINDLKQRFKDGQERILRTTIDWSNATQLKEQVQALEKEKKDLQQTLKDKSAVFLLPTGWKSAKELGEDIDRLRQAMEQVEQEQKAKTYKVALPDGTWANEQELDMALVNAIIAPEIRESLEKGRKNIAVSAKVDKEQRDIEAEKLRNWLDTFPSLAAPRFAMLDLELKWKRALLEEFRREQDSALHWLTQELRWLERNRRYLP